MSDQTLLYWGMVVTMFILIAGMLTARDLIEMYFNARRGPDDESADADDSGVS